MTSRKLLDQEQEILEILIAHSDIANKSGIREWMESCECETLSDEGMGSIRFNNLERDNSQAKFSYTGAEAEFTDKDGVTVLVCLNISNEGYPFEIDFWKVNFAPLVEYPRPQDLKFAEK